MSFQISDVANSSMIGQNLYGPSWVLAHDIDTSSKYRLKPGVQSRSRDIVMKGLPVLTEAQLRAGETMASLEHMEKKAVETLEDSMATKRKIAAKKKLLEGLEEKEAEPVQLKKYGPAPKPVPEPVPEPKEK